MSLSVEKINNALVLQGITLQNLAEEADVTKKEIISFMREEGFTYDFEEGFFIKSDDLQQDLLQRVKELEKQQKEILELLSNTNTIKKENKLDLSLCTEERIQKSYKLSKTTAEKFSEYCKNHREYRVQDLITLALEQFMEKNK
ncbi:hypothetical protein [Clostridium tarantellae]|uniref:Uncharacterized protein n=1 Tax=Clostridium tarantellae TaxID=39493 RepID=A0A6I1MP59_9CLOT|nr:hypothetical protein [Clostridium tarantellae]MPQ44854.1 hypothetical protein [Clostridium tarantellae]